MPNWLTDLTPANFPVSEESGSPIETRDETGVTATAVLRCNWSQRWDIVNDILDNALLYPHKTETRARAWNASIQPAPAKTEQTDIIVGAGPGGVVQSRTNYAEALLSIYFTSAEFNSLNHVYVEALEPNGELLNLPYTLFSWPNGVGMLPEETPPLLVEGYDYVVSWRNLLTIKPEFFTFLNKVNAESTTIPRFGLTALRGELYYNPPHLVSNKDAFNIQRFSLTARWSWRQNDWNKQYHAIAQAWEFPRITGTSIDYIRYPYVDMSEILPYTIAP